MKPPRIPDGLVKGGHVQPNSVSGHLDKINKVLSQISFGSSTPDPVNPGKTVISNASPDRNIKVFKATGIAPGVADTDFTITHNLGAVPTTIVGQDTTNGGLLYRSPVTAWSTTTITLRCTKASSAYIVYVDY
jgi:hypothetical protein